MSDDKDNVIYLKPKKPTAPTEKPATDAPDTSVGVVFSESYDTPTFPEEFKREYFDSLKQKLYFSELVFGKQLIVNDFIEKLTKAFDEKFDPAIREVLSQSGFNSFTSDYSADDMIVCVIVGDKVHEADGEGFVSSHVLFAIPGGVTIRSKQGWDQDEIVEEVRERYLAMVDQGMKEGFDEELFKYLSVIYDGDFVKQ